MKKHILKNTYLVPCTEVLAIIVETGMLAGSKQIKVSNSTTRITSLGVDYGLETGGANNSGDWGSKRWGASFEQDRVGYE